MRHILSTALVAVIVGGVVGATVGAVAQTDPTPAGPAAGSAINADRVETVGAGRRKRRLLHPSRNVASSASWWPVVRCLSAP
jgi:hypothetical protein